MPVSVLQHVIELENAAREKIAHDHHRKPDVQSPERDADVLFRIRPALVGRHLPECEDHQRNREHPENAHERRVRMIGREHRTGLEVAHDRHIDEEAEHTSADEIPDSHRHQEVKRPSMRHGNILAADIASRARQRDEIPRVERKQRERHDFHRREDRAERHRDLRLAGEVPMMAGADDPAAEIEQRVKIDDAGRGRAGNDPELVEDDRDRAGHEQLEKILDPEMDDPESPQVDDGEVRRGVEKERGHVKDRNRDRGGDEQAGKLARFVAAQPRRDRAVQQHDP